MGEEGWAVLDEWLDAETAERLARSRAAQAQLALVARYVARYGLLAAITFRCRWCGQEDGMAVFWRATSVQARCLRCGRLDSATALAGDGPEERRERDGLERLMTARPRGR